MFDRRSALELIAGTTQDQCREIGALLSRFADAPRDPAFKAMVRTRRDKEPPFDRAAYLDNLRIRGAKRDAQLREAGWLPHQMQAKLERLGYQPDPETIEEPSFEEIERWRAGQRPEIEEGYQGGGFDQQVWELLGQATQAECRELASLFSSLAAAERDADFDAMMAGLLEACPRIKTELEQRMEEGARRVFEYRDAPLWRTGWHPLQMERKLEELGHTAPRLAA